MGDRGQITIPLKARKIFELEPKSDLHIAGDIKKGIGITKQSLKHKKVIKEDHHYYGTARISERGQLVIPQDARDDFGFNTGDLLLVFGDIKKGLGLIKSTTLKNFAVKLFQAFGFMDSEENIEMEDDEDE